MKANLRVLGAIVAPLPILALAVAPASASQGPAARVAFSNEIVSAVSQSTHTGSLAAGQKLSLEISLAPRNEAGLNAFIKEVSTPGSALYQHYLTVAQYAANYGASDATIAAVSSYLKSEGLSVGAVTANHMTIATSGTTAQVEKAFNVALGTYRQATGDRDFYANAAAPSLPTSLASEVVGIAGLSNYAQHTADNIVAKKVSPNVTGDITPTKARGAYNLTTDISDGYKGTGETIGLVEFSSYTASDVAEYNSYYSLGASTPTVVKVDGGTTDDSGEVEDELDIEVANALAPGAKVAVYEAPNSDAGEVALYAALVSADVPVVSSSWGEPETEEDNLTSDDADFKEAAAQGQSIYSASGDDGADDNGSSLSVDYPASDPYVTGVGGTDLTLSGNTWSKETGWSDSGGGVSVEWATPSFQTKVDTGAYRDVPDVAADADPSSGWYIYTEGGFEEVGGTSAAAPNWASFTADYDTAAADLGKAKFGFSDSFIYTVAQSSEYSSAFHDITSGSNGHYSAKTGYDQVTGWGSYNGGNFIADEL